MDVKFYSNKISLKGKSFEDFVQEQLNKGKEKVKTASEEKVVKTADKEEEESSGQPEVEAKLVNEPKKEKVKGKAKGTAKCDEAETSGQLKVEPLHQKGESTGKKASKNTDLCDDCGKPVNFCKCEGKKEDKEEKGDKKEDKKEEKEDKKEEKEATSRSLIKLSKLDSKTRTFLADYWKNLYPAEYVEAMLAEQ